ncbi:MAG: LuxR C-terminal-related transcriptional regulator [Chloroflexota bacterium]|nr:LuxR C-terminal-related transcriptional regulator [Chloroflexota bacterium]
MTDPTPDDSRSEQWKPLVFPNRERMGVPLPASVTTFVGREREVRKVAAILSSPHVRLVTLTGPGGVGKTRLSLELADGIADQFTDGVAFVDLAPVATPKLVGSTVAHALGMREAGDRPIEDRLVDALRDRHLLLVFDNFEPVVAAAPLVSYLLAGCPRLTVLATSREPLRLTAEWVIAVPPLTLPDLARSSAGPVESEAVRLFVDRAQAARADFVLTNANARCVIQIVHRLEGLPLAIELAAARLAHLPPVTLLQRLDRRLPLLTGGARDLPERQRTLRDAIAWSYDLTTPEEQRLFRRLAIFTGGCTLEAAEAVATTDGNPGTGVLDVLASLVSKSLVRQEEDVDGGPRFTMLETVREFGWEQLAATGEEQSSRDRHAAYFVDLVERADPAIWGGPNHEYWLDRLEAELANLRAALAWLEDTGDGLAFLGLAASLGGFWHYRSHRVEGRVWLTRALAASHGTVSASRAMALIKLGMLERVMGGAQAVDLSRQGLAMRRQLGDKRGIGRGLMNLGNALRDHGIYAEAVTVLEEAAAVLGPVGDIGGLATVRMYLGMVALEQGDPLRAHALLTDALALHQQDGFAYGVASTLLALGRIEADRGNVAGAANCHAESLDLWIDVRSQEGLVDAVAATATLAMTCERPETGARLLGAASAMADALGYVAPPSARERAAGAAEARAALGQPAFDEALEAGRALSPGEAAAEALAALDSLRVAGSQATATPGDRALFTPREQDVLRLLVEGRSDREIAEALGIGYRTVASYVRNILAKFDVTSRTAAATLAVRRDLV